MLNRKKVLIIYGIIYTIFAFLMYFGLKLRMTNKFSEVKLAEMISGKSMSRDITTDLCRYQILGDPKEEGTWVKVNINCKDGSRAKSTLSLSAIEDKTIKGFMKEYARIMGFDTKLFNEQKFECY